MSRKNTNVFSLKIGIIVSADKSMMFLGSKDIFSLIGSVAIPNLSRGISSGSTSFVLRPAKILSEQNASLPTMIYIVSPK